MSKYLTQTFMSPCNEMICQHVTLSCHAESPKVADAVIEASLTTLHCSTVFCWQVADHLAGLPTPPTAHRRPRAVRRGAAACAHRRGQSRVGSVVDPRRSCAVSPAAVPVGSDQGSEACPTPATTPGAPPGAVACTAPTPCGMFPDTLVSSRG